jgi:methylmalonyl-CoA carboxyltransferase large subunit
MNELTIADLQVQMEALKAQIAELAARLPAQTPAPATPAAAAASVAAVAAPAPPVAEVSDAAAEISEETLLAISAAVAAYLGVRAHIKTIRLIGSGAWAQQGRVFLQASHRLNVQNMRPRSASE